MLTKETLTKDKIANDKNLGEKPKNSKLIEPNYYIIPFLLNQIPVAKKQLPILNGRVLNNMSGNTKIATNISKWQSFKQLYY